MKVFLNLQWVHKVRQGHFSSKVYCSWVLWACIIYITHKCLQITKDVVKDPTLLPKSSEAVRQLRSDFPAELVQMHTILLTKIYNARSNEFLQAITKTVMH